MMLVQYIFMGTTEDALKIPYVHDVMEKYFYTYDGMLEFVNKLELEEEK